MRIVNLIENTQGRIGCAFAHGLSFYVETGKHRLLMDLGPSEETVRNAQTMGIDLATVDTVVLSHGHYDHSGGIMPFSAINDRAAIYMQAAVTEDYFKNDGEADPPRYRYIGIDKRIAALPQVKMLRGDCRIDDELDLFTMKRRSHKLPSSSKRMMVRQGEAYRPDDFVHEQYLVVREGGRKVLMSGCAHNGILSILDAFIDKYGEAPDLVVSGFHLMKKSDYTEDEIREIEEIAKELNTYPTQFSTCHCTGVPAFDVMKTIMGDKLTYVHTGEEV